MVITREWIGQHATGEAGWTRKQLAVLGVSWPPMKGWRSRLIGTRVSPEVAQAFERLGAERRAQLVAKVVANDTHW